MFFYLRRLFLFCFPFLVLIVIYIVSDPFMILYKYEDFNKNFYIHKNNDFVATEMYLKNSNRYLYDSFIFGGSTALFVTPSIWKNYINTSNNIFSFAAPQENIVGIWSKIRYLNKNNHKIKFALLTLDDFTFTKFINNDPLYMKHYKVYPSSKFYFQYKYFLNFLNLKFLTAIVHYKICNQFYPYMDKILLREPYYYDSVTNEYFNVGILNELKKDSLTYYEKINDKFPFRNTKYTEKNPIINSQQIQMLIDIRNIFAENNTDFRLLICPSYDQIAFNKNDLALVQTIFNKENVFDFTGINEFTEKKSNFYDGLHFKQYVVRELMDIMYLDNSGK
jgi:hypothetical protein